MNPHVQSHLRKGLLSVLILGACAAGCKEENPFFNPDFLPPGEVCFEGRETVQEVTTFQDPSLLDVLFVVSNAPGTEAVQQRLAAAVPRFVSLLKSQDIDYQIGVTTGDTRDPDAAGALKAGGEGIVGCEDSPRIVTEAAGDRAGTFAACNVLQGSEGATVQEYLEATQTAFTLRNTEPQDSGGNAGFLRARAGLMIVVIADRDDCSNDEFDLNSLGANNAPTACDLANTSGDLSDIEETADFLVGLKADPNAIAFALLGGSDDGRDIGQDEALAPTCADASGRPIFPSSRLLKISDLFHPRSAFESACAASYGLSVAHVSRLAAPQNVVVCPDARLTEAPLSVTIGGNDIDQGEDGYIFLGETDDCDNGAIEINSDRLVGAQGNLEISFCGR